MKDDKKIIKEVKRLQEIMGINKPLLLENPKLITDLISTLARKEFTKFSKELTTAIRVLTDATTAEAKKVAADKVIQLARKQSPELYKKIMNVAAKDVDVAKVLDDLFDSKEINNFRLSVQKLLQKGKTDGQILDTYRAMISRSDLTEIQRAAMEQRIRDEISSLRKTTDGIPAYSNDGVRVTDDVVDTDIPPKVDDVVDTDIPPNNSKTLDDGTEVSDLFNTNTWKDDMIKLTDDEIAALANPKWWDSITESFTSIFKSTNEQVSKIQKIAQSIEKTTDSNLKTILTKRLKDEMEKLYKKNTNKFVALKQYFEDVSRIDLEFRKTWNLLKNVNGGWDFYKTFGNVARHNSTWKQLWAGLKDDLKVLFEVEQKFFSKIVDKVSKKVSTSKSEMIGTTMNNIWSGSRKGRPKMTNELYKDLIKNYGPKAAKVAYVRDLALNLLKWNIYIGLFITIRNSIANYAYEDNIQDCIDSDDENSEACLALSDDYISTMMSKWSLEYRKDPTKAVSFFEAWAKQIIPWSSANLPDFSSDLKYRDLGELLKMDLGFVGNILNNITKFISINDDPAVKNSTLEALNLAITKVKVEKDKAEKKIDEVIEEEGINIPNISNKVDLVTPDDELRSNNDGSAF